MTLLLAQNVFDWGGGGGSLSLSLSCLACKMETEGAPGYIAWLGQRLD